MGLTRLVASLEGLVYTMYLIVIGTFAACIARYKSFIALHISSFVSLFGKDNRFVFLGPVPPLSDRLRLSSCSRVVHIINGCNMMGQTFGSSLFHIVIRLSITSIETHEHFDTDSVRVAVVSDVATVERAHLNTLVSRRAKPSSDWIIFHLFLVLCETRTNLNCLPPDLGIRL